MSPVLPPEPTRPSPLRRVLCGCPLMPGAARHPAGATWDCPSCGRVWVAVDVPASFGSSSVVVGGRTWTVASRRTARRHRARLTADATPGGAPQ